MVDSPTTDPLADDGSKGGRRKARKRAFEILYGLHFEPPADERSLSRRFAACPRDEDAPIRPENRDFAWELVLGAWANQRELDEVITRFSKNWKLARIAKVELSILRLALHEILYRQDIPLRVAINEAVELAKTYGDDNSPTFVNGILDAVARAVDNGEFTIRKGL
ncbi:transcription antitermination factor NusB [Desulfolutivibrio sulfoxidireducens]|uniref:transcription antitermination factor NusB n=1 Tax=Desulfolutivibrio sulfoxidireducens TaxID=2773299 RepID=UPI00159DAD67|nr:transcription antitermination factor NusB [Desulfolutivibrio sulfoxidireducens]QLA15166.1 transcription antitermination factor NusB [Desulfolutivibrio sulfoxidireducens]QLA18737.1 transcription antitermination factor NusB [Desulfolutivibrio sulfoxidireducens]